MCSYQGKPWEIKEAVLAGEAHAAPWAGAVVLGGPGMSQEIMRVSEQLTHQVRSRRAAAGVEAT